MLTALDYLDSDLAIAAAMAVLAGLMRGFTGFGSAMLMAPVFAILFGPAQTIVIIIFMELAVSVQLTPSALRDTEWRFVAPMSIAAGLFMPLGSLVLVNVDGAVLSRVIAGVVVAFVLTLLTGWRYTGAKKPAVATAIGALSGAMMAATSIGGPPVLLYMLSGPDRAITNRANIITYLTLTQIFLLFVMWGVGVVGWPTFWRGAFLAPLFMAGALAGSRLFRQSGEVLYRRVALVFLMGVGLFGLLR